MRSTTTKPDQLPVQPVLGTQGAMVKKRLTKEEAWEQIGPPPQGHAWNEEDQEYQPLAQVHLAARLAEPTDLEGNLQAFKRNRETLLRFIRDYLEEADYDKKGAPITGRLRDYYKLPGSEQKALTKAGASKLCQLFRYFKGRTHEVSSTLTKEFTASTVEVEIADQYHRAVGSGVGACNTAEAGFRGAGAIKKYGGRVKWVKRDGERSEPETVEPPDYRAAQHDVTSRAGKRAFVQGTIVAVAAEEIFTVAKEDEPSPAGERAEDQVEAKTPPAERRKFPPQIKHPDFQDLAGKFVDEVPTDRLTALRKWCAEYPKPEQVKAFIEAIDQVLEDRRHQDAGELAL